MNLKDHIRAVPDFPKKGILFYDISTLLANAKAWSYALDQLQERLQAYNIDTLIGIESRGFLTAAPLADRMGLGFAMVRKKGKLPGKVIGQSYDLEYGQDILELQPDLLKPGSRVAICDDLLATGGTLEASVKLLEQAGLEVCASCFLIELGFLKGRERLEPTPVESLMIFDQ